MVLGWKKGHCSLMLEMSSIHGPRNITHQLLCNCVSQQPFGESAEARGQLPVGHL